MSIDLFLHHPNVAQIKPDFTCFMCYGQIENCDEFVAHKTSDLAPILINKDTYETLINFWVRMKKIKIQRVTVGLFNFSTKNLYSIDYVGERDGQIFLIFCYYSEQKRGKLKIDIRKMAEEVLMVCQNQYKIDVSLAVVNVYGEGKVEGSIY